MFRLWGKIYKKNRIINDIVIANANSHLSMTTKVEDALEEMCLFFDIQKPLWFDNNHRHFKEFGQTSFSDDHFIESIDFDYFEIEIIEDDKKRATPRHSRSDC
jgi:hypothetical protein